MLLKKWLFRIMVLLLLCTTHAVIFFAGVWSQKAPDYQYFEFYQKDGQIHAGIAIPDNLLSGNFKQDCQVARDFLCLGNEWIFVISGPVPGLDGHTGFVFRARAVDEGLLLQ